MKVFIDISKIENVGELPDELKKIGIDPSRPFNLQTDKKNKRIIVRQNDLKKEREISDKWGYCWSCKEVTELAGETCSECGAYV